MYEAKGSGSQRSNIYYEYITEIMLYMTTINTKESSGSVIELLRIAVTIFPSTIYEYILLRTTSLTLRKWYLRWFALILKMCQRNVHRTLKSEERI